MRSTTFAANSNKGVLLAQLIMVSGWVVATHGGSTPQAALSGPCCYPTSVGNLQRLLKLVLGFAYIVSAHMLVVRTDHVASRQGSGRLPHGSSGGGSPPTGQGLTSRDKNPVSHGLWAAARSYFHRVVSRTERAEMDSKWHVTPRRRSVIVCGCHCCCFCS